MAVKRVRKITRGGSFKDSERSYNHEFLVEVDPTTGDDETTALGAPGLPKLGQSHPTDPYSICIEISARQTVAVRPHLYTIDVAYSTSQAEDPQNLGENTAPDARQPELEADTITVEREIFQDEDGEWLCNTAGDMFPREQRLIPMELLVVRFKRWYHSAVFQPETVTALKHKVNSAAWRGKDARTVKITGCRATREFYEQQLYYQVDFELTHNPDGWLEKRVNEGFRVIDETKKHDRRTLTFVDDLGVERPAEEPQKLNEDGDDVLGPDEDPIILEFRVCADLDFESVGL
jgi:hypothetical protein